MSENHVIKLLHPRFPRAKAELELNITPALHAAGLPVPAACEIREFDSRFGIILERIDLSSLQRTATSAWRCHLPD